MCRGRDHQPTSIEDKRAEEEGTLGILHSYRTSTENLDPNIHSFLTCLENDLRNGNGVQVRDRYCRSFGNTDSVPNESRLGPSTEISEQ